MPGLEELSREELIALVRAQQDQITGLAGKVAKLEHLLSRNSGNSSMPPSLDDKPGATPPKSKARPTTKRARGKQKGAPGANLSWSDAPTERVDRFPQGVCGCGADLAGGSDLGVVDAFQRIEIPAVTASVIQYDQHAVRCRCAKVHTAARPDGAGTGKVVRSPAFSGQ